MCRSFARWPGGKGTIWITSGRRWTLWKRGVGPGFRRTLAEAAGQDLHLVTLADNLLFLAEHRVLESRVAPQDGPVVLLMEYLPTPQYFLFAVELYRPRGRDRAAGTPVSHFALMAMGLDIPLVCVTPEQIPLDALQPGQTARLTAGQVRIGPVAARSSRAASAALRSGHLSPRSAAPFPPGSMPTQRTRSRLRSPRERCVQMTA